MHAPERNETERTHDETDDERSERVRTHVPAGDLHAQLLRLKNVDIGCPHCNTCTPALSWNVNALALVCPNCDALTYTATTLSVRIR